NQLALLLVEQQDPNKRNRALQFAGISAQLNSQSADAQMTWAWVLYQLGRSGDAEQALRNALQLGNLSPDSSYLLSKILVETQKADAAKQVLKATLENDSQGIFVYRKDAEDLAKTLK